MKKIGIISILSALSLLNNYAHANGWEGGFTQFGIGYQNQSLSDSGGVSNGTLDPNVGSTYSGLFSNKGSFTTQIGGGYNFSLSKNYLLGVGFDITPFPNSAINFNVTDGVNSYGYSVKAKTNYDYYFDLAAVLDRKNLAYVKLGGSTTSFNNLIGNANGTLGGLGIKHKIHEGLYGYGEINYTKYKNTSDGDVGTISGNGTNLLAGIGYKF